MTPHITVGVLHPITRLIVGGAQENTLFTAALLDKSRYQVQVLSGPQTGSEGSLIDEAEEYGVPLIILPELVRQINPLYDLITIIKMYRIMRGKRYAIVHTHSSKAGILGRFAARFAKVPVILHTVHGWPFHDYMSPMNRKLYIFLEQLTASFTNQLIVVTAKDIDKGLKAGIGTKDQYTLIRSAIPLNIFDPHIYDKETIRSELGIPTDASVLGNVGRFSPQKNPLDWVRAAGKVFQSQPGSYFLLVGDGPMRTNIETALVAEGIRDRTILTGLRRDPARMMAAMDIFLLTSLWEGLPRVIPQAMAMKLPVIAYRADGTEEIILDGANGYLCNPGDYKRAAEYCIDLMNNREKSREMGLRGYAIAHEEYDINQMISRIEIVYENSLSQ